jgi:phage shock protein PspC (stress-responsive transcriptional regulator)
VAAVRDRLYRSRDDRILFGVAGGVAEWLDLDPALVRIIWALLIFAGGIGFFLYIVMAFVIPEEPEDYEPMPYMAGDRYSGVAGGTPAVDPATGQPMATPPPAASSWEADRAARHADREARRAARRAARKDRDGRGAVVFGAILVIIGAWFLLRNYLPQFDDRLFGPVFLIVVGVIVVAMAVRRGQGTT